MRKNIICLDSVDSTNLYLKRLAEDGAPDGTVVTANVQTAGKGRQGHSFISSSGGMYYSMLLRSEGLSLDDIMTVTAKAGVCVCRALNSAFGILAGIKWVNDVFYHDKKICGILVEAAPFNNGKIPWLIIGIGINLNQKFFPAEISDIATSLWIEHHRDFSFDVMKEVLTEQLDILRENLSSAFYLEEYRRLCITTGKEIIFSQNGSTHHCRALGIDDHFGLITDEGILHSGEISVRPHGK